MSSRHSVTLKECDRYFFHNNCLPMTYHNGKGSAPAALLATVTACCSRGVFWPDLLPAQTRPAQAAGDKGDAGSDGEAGEEGPSPGQRGTAPPLPSRLLSACTVNFTLFTEWILKSLLTPILKIIILSEDPDGKPLLDYFSQKEALVVRK